MSTCGATSDAGYARLRATVEEVYRDTDTTKSGIVRPKTNKRREVEKAVAEAVVQFAFNHGGYRGEHLAPAGLWFELMPKPAGPGDGWPLRTTTNASQM